MKWALYIIAIAISFFSILLSPTFIVFVKLYKWKMVHLRKIMGNISSVLGTITSEWNMDSFSYFWLLILTSKELILWKKMLFRAYNLFINKENLLSQWCQWYCGKHGYAPNMSRFIYTGQKTLDVLGSYQKYLRST